MRWKRFKWMLRWPVMLIVVILMPLYLAADAEAHKISVFAWVEGDRIHGQSKFSGGRKPKNASVIVTDLNGRELLKTRTNDEGEFSFAIPHKTDLRIQLLAGPGHQGEWRIAAEELDASEIIPDRTPPAETQKSSPPDLPPHPDQTTVDMQALQEMLEKTLDQKLRPVLNKLTVAQTRKVSLQDIIGGIGYILGLMGIAMYFKSRQGNPK
jgi:nickel transport protein